MIKNQSSLPYIAESLLYCTASIAWCTPGYAMLQSANSRIVDLKSTGMSFMQHTIIALKRCKHRKLSNQVL